MEEDKIIVVEYSSHVRARLRTIKGALQDKFIIRMSIFLIFYAAVVPRFAEYKYYFLLDQMQLSKFDYGMIFLVS